MLCGPKVRSYEMVCCVLAIVVDTCFIFQVFNESCINCGTSVFSTRRGSQRGPTKFKSCILLTRPELHLEHRLGPVMHVYNLRSEAMQVERTHVGGLHVSVIE